MTVKLPTQGRITSEMTGRQNPIICYEMNVAPFDSAVISIINLCIFGCQSFCVANTQYHKQYSGESISTL